MKQNNYRVSGAPQRRPPHRSGEWSDAATILFPWSIATIVFLVSSFIVLSHRNAYLKVFTSYNTGLEALERHKHSYQTLREALDVSKVGLADDDDDEEDEEDKLRREEAINMKITNLQKYIQTESHRETEDRFGDGPYRVKVEVIFPFLENGNLGDVSNEADRIKSIILEMAPLGLMPHSTHLFLEQVYHKLWDGCIFSVNSNGKLQVTTSSLEKVSEHLPRFQAAELDTVSFQEYNEDFEHEKYTIGFSGRPGGPDWYINTQDNIEANGPGGNKMIYTLDHEADPCFGRVIHGYDVIEKLTQLPTSRSGHFEKFPVIKTARIMGDSLY